MKVPGRLDLSRVDDFRSEPLPPNETVSRPMNGPAQRRMLYNGVEGSFVLSAVDTKSNDLREYICTMSEKRGDLPSSDLPIGNMFVFSDSDTFQYRSVMLSLVQNEPRGLVNFVVGFKATGKVAV